MSRSAVEDLKLNRLCILQQQPARRVSPQQKSNILPAKAMKFIFCLTLLHVIVAMAGVAEAALPADHLPMDPDHVEGKAVALAGPTGKPPLDKEKLLNEDPYADLVNQKGLIDRGFIHAFVASLSVIIVSELGDKTFFIAAIMAMRHPRSTVFAGAICALAAMTILSSLLGYATTVIPRWLTYYVSSGLFAIFGLKMLKEGYDMSPDEGQEEYDEVKEELRKNEEEYERQGTSNMDAETGIIKTPHRRVLYTFFSRIFLQSFTLTFLAEWGDRSQIATIILAARDEVLGVIIGGTLGHALCTGLAVIGGRFIAQRISIRTVTFIGGIVFLIFALSAFIIEPDD